MQRVLQLNKQEAKKIKPKKAKKDDEVYIYDEIMKAVNRMDDARANEIGGDACIVLSTESADMVYPIVLAIIIVGSFSLIGFLYKRKGHINTRRLQ